MLKSIFILCMTAGLAQAEPQSLVIFHTNDIHGHFAASPAGWRKDHAPVGGFVALEEHLDSLRRLYPNSLYLDAGDLMTGNPICNIEYNGVKGGALLDMMSLCKLDAECLGNHEFDLGVPHLRDYVARAKYPILCGNLREKSNGKYFVTPSHVFQVGKLRVGVIGLIMDNLSDVVSRTTLQSFSIDSAAVAAQKEINALDPTTDLMVLLTHIGVEGDSALATRLHCADVIVGGHSHTRLEHPLRVNGILIVQAGSYGENLGVLKLTVDADTVQSYDGVLDELILWPRTKATPLASLSDSFEQAIQKEYGQVIGTLTDAWKPSYYSSSNVGNWMCDRLREHYHTDIAFINAGGIRSSVNAGPITLLDVQQVLPFFNSCVTFEATGADLLKLAGEQANAQAHHTHGVLEMSGLKISYGKQGDSTRVTEVTADSKRVEPGKTYTIATIDYVAVSQWEHHLGFKPEDVQTTGDLLSDVMAAEIRKTTTPIQSPTEQRLTEIR